MHVYILFDYTYVCENFYNITGSGDCKSESVIITLNNCKQMEVENQSRVIISLVVKQEITRRSSMK